MVGSEDLVVDHRDDIGGRELISVATQQQDGVRDQDEPDSPGDALDTTVHEQSQKRADAVADSQARHDTQETQVP